VIFTSYSYVAFLAAAFGLHWLLPARFRIPFLIFASYLFYCSWKWQYGFLLLGVSVLNWAVGRRLGEREGRVGLLWGGILGNLLPLLYFKYTGFLVGAASDFGRLTGLWSGLRVPAILLPLGISFFSFQGIAYLVDVYGGERPFMRLPHFLLFKGFWPQLIAGPIIRPSQMHGQIEGDRRLAWEDVQTGCRRILQGFLKKVVLADNLAPVVEMVFTPNAHPGFVDVAAGVLGFGMQIYLDFSAYSDIAVGSARLFGFRFPENFDWPYLATGPREFWSRWHMTLSSWIRDYLFTPMAFELRARRALLPLAVLASMGLCGLWHGAAWTFILWGLWHGVLICLGELMRPVEKAIPPNSVLSRIAVPLATVFTLVGVFAGWLLFRSPSVGQAASMAAAFFTFSGGLRPLVLRENAVLLVGLFGAGTFAVHLLHSLSVPFHGLGEGWRRIRPAVQPALDALAVALVIVADRGAQAFVYFQF
jgi:alginate O-acetyltransferase complex protein AlgI